jgi:glycosyltransferase involved in cell wall biosynthesis
MTPPADIICFAKDWNEPKTSNNHVMEELAKRHRVLWVNSLATRAPKLGSAHDIKKIFRRLHQWLRGTEHIHEKLRVLAPLLLPLPRSSWAQRFNRWLVAAQVRNAAQSWGFDRPQLWIFPPNAVDFVGQFDESLVVYYCVDEWSEFTYLNAQFIRQKEAELLRKAHAVFVSSQRLFDTKRLVNSNTHLIPHGVNHSLFAQALEPDFPVAKELRDLPRPIVGFYGNLYDWVDQQLIAEMARLRPHWSFVLIGKIMSDISTLRACENIRILGPRPYEELPKFCKGFDVGIIPYNMRDPRMQSVNPLKLREYLAAGLPVVSVDLPEARVLANRVQFAASAAEFVEKIEVALQHNSAPQKIERSRSVLSESWTARVAEIERVLLSAHRPLSPVR